MEENRIGKELKPNFVLNRITLRMNTDIAEIVTIQLPLPIKTPSQQISVPICEIRGQKNT